MKGQGADSDHVGGGGGGLAGGVRSGCGARHERLVVPARLVEATVGVRAEMSVVALHEQLVGILLGVG